MKRYAVVAFGPGRAEIRGLFTLLHEKGCTVDSCLLTSFGSGFAASMLILGQKEAISNVVNTLKDTILIKATNIEGQSTAVHGNLQMTLYGPNRPETLRLVSEMISSECGEITEIESKSLGSMSVLAIQARCPGKIASIRAQLNAISKKLGLKSSVERIRPEDLL